MRIPGRPLVGAALALAALARCGGAVDGDEARDGVDASVDAACVPGAPGCPPSDAGAPDQDASLAPEGGDAPASDASDAPLDAGSDSGPCILPDGSSYECDPLAQCGCGFGMACDLLGLTSWIAKEGSACRPAGIAKPYTHCAEDEDCRPGFTCVSENCRTICATDSDCDGVDPYRKCINFEKYETFGTSVLPYGYCIAACDPITPTSDHNDPTFVPCGPGFHCVPGEAWVEKGAGMGFCMFWSDKPRLGWGQPCEKWADCMPGFACVPEPVDGGLAEPGSGELACRRWCEVGSICSSATGTHPCTPVGLSVGPIELGLCPL